MEEEIIIVQTEEDNNIIEVEETLQSIDQDEVIEYIEVDEPEEIVVEVSERFSVSGNANGDFAPIEHSHG
jgi:hypothetical protein